MTSASLPRVAVIGSAASRLATLTAELELAGALAAPDAPDHTVGMLIVAELHQEDGDWASESPRAQRVWDEVTAAWPKLAAPATGLLIGFGDSRSRAARRRRRAELADLCAWFELEAASTHGVEFTMNAIELPPQADERLLQDRLLPFVRSRTTLAASVVLTIEDLEEDSIGEALTAEYL